MRGLKKTAVLCVTAMLLAVALRPAPAGAVLPSEHPYALQSWRLSYETSAADWAVPNIDRAYHQGFVPPDLIIARAANTWTSENTQFPVGRTNSYQWPLSRANFARLAVCWVEYALAGSAADIIADRGLTVQYGAFADTSDPYVLAAYTLGIVSGTRLPTAEEQGLFDPGGGITREQAAVLVRNACAAVGMDTTDVSDAGFADMDEVSTWAADAVNFVRNAGIMSGTGVEVPTFSPKMVYSLEQSLATFGGIDLGYTPEEYFPIPYGGLEYRLTEAEVLARINAYRDIYPHNSPMKEYGEFFQYLIGHNSLHQCAAFAEVIRYGAFGWLPYDYLSIVDYDEATDTAHVAYDRIRVGDVVRIDQGGGHSVVVLAVDGSKITVAEGNYNEKVYWDRVIDLKALWEKDIEFWVTSSYPQN